MRFRVPTRVAVSAPAVGLGILIAGCAHSETAADRHIAEMRESIGKLQVEQDRTNERTGLTEITATDAPGPAPKPHPAAMARTIQIGDVGDAHENDDPNDPSARPEIRLHGSPGVGPRSGRRTSRGRFGDEARIDLAVDDVPQADTDAKKSNERGRTGDADAEPRGRGAGPKESR